MKKNLVHINKKGLLVLLLYSMAVTVVAQTPAVDLQQQFVAYQTNNYNEKLFVHTDKTFYLSGETIWFKLYCVDENYHRLSDISKVAYVEIISAENKPVLQVKIALDKGTGNGAFIIPSYIYSGNYTLRAYTKWMENFSVDYFFQTPVTIINTLKKGILKDQSQNKTYNIAFFPEGGDLVENIPSVIAFKAVDANGQPVDCSGTIVSDNNTVTRFTSLKFGMGSFSLTPKPGEHYKAIMQLVDTTITKDLPSVYKQGFVMHAMNADDEHIKVAVSTNTNDNMMYMLVHGQNVLKDFQQTAVSNGNAVFTIDKNKLPDGISVITLFNAAKQPVSERLYFKRPVNTLSIQTQANQAEYAARKPVNISVTTNTNAPVSADMSVAVFMIDSLQSTNYNDILSYLLLSSELKGAITQPSYYFQNTKAADEAADNLMLTQGWRRFKWEDVLQNKKPFFEFIPEHEGLIIDGKITDASNNAAKNIDVTLTVPGENFQLTHTQSDASGTLLFNVKKFYGSDNIIITTDSNYRATIASSYSNKFTQQTAPAFAMPVKWKDQLVFRSINAQADNAYLINDKQHAYSYDTEDTTLFYGKPDNRYYLDDYTRFVTMEEVMREYVAEVRVRKNGDQFYYKVLNPATKLLLDNDPLVLLDGMPVQNINRIMQFDPLKIKKVDVVTHKYYYRNMVAGGIISYSTYHGDLADFPLNANEIAVQFEGLQHEREFYAPVYNTDEEIKNRLPDVRNVLYWSPNIKTDADGKTSFNFYTSDITGKFACIVQGITANGMAGSSIITFDVTK